jgi:2-polyprenyl-3-methyl-5-hydroxy-6-metoxy-1,4-benzoquinol methylase
MEIFVWPHTSQFNVDNDLNYQFWLRNDHSRETAYRKAIEDLRKSKSAKSILDAGTGTGVWAIAMALAFPKAKVDAIDLHKENIDLAKASLGNFPTVQNNVSFKIVDINQYAPDKKYDIICTELDGGLGNNEGAKKAFKSLQKLLTPNGTIIPLKIDTYTVPVSLEGINEKLPNTGANPFLKNRGIIIKNPYSCYYLVYGVDSSSLLAESKILDTIKTIGTITESYTKKLDFGITKNAQLTGFLIWFKHQLTGGVAFTNQPDSTLTSWGQAYFPIHEIRVKKGDKIDLIFSEIVKEDYALPYYEWEVKINGDLIEKNSNAENQIRRI